MERNFGRGKVIQAFSTWLGCVSDYICFRRQTVLMRQYFYIIAHTIVGDDLCIDKVFLQEHEAIRYGRLMATKNPYSVYLYKQEIARTAKVQYVKLLPPFRGSDWDIDPEIP